MIDYMIMEAVAMKVHKEEEKARKEAERREWKRQKQQELKQQFK